MERRFAARLQEMLAQAEVSPELARGLFTRLEQFVAPFADSWKQPEQRRHATEYLTGLLSNLKRKTGEGIAYLLDQHRQGLPKFLGDAPWDHAPRLATLTRQVGRQLGDPDAVIVFDPSGFPKKGDRSVGVARQWCGRIGKVDNCQICVYAAYVSFKGHALVNMRLYVPEEWARDRSRRQAAGVPKSVAFRTRHELALEMLAECGTERPHAWVAGDDEMGRPASFRRKLNGLTQRYLLAVPSNTLIRDRDAPPPEYSGRGRRPKNPFSQVNRWRAALPAGAWTRIEVRDGEKGPLTIDAVKRRARARTETGGEGPDETLFITRELQSDQTYKLDYYLSNAKDNVSLHELARVAKAAHRIEECFERAKGEAGLADYQVRNWDAWHRHQTLSLMAAWFLNEETRRGKNPDSGTDLAATARVDRGTNRAPARHQPTTEVVSPQHPLAATQRASSVLLPSFT